MPGRVDYIAALVDPGTKATHGPHRRADKPGQLLKRDMFVRCPIKSRAEHAAFWCRCRR